MPLNAANTVIESGLAAVSGWKQTFSTTNLEYMCAFAWARKALPGLPGA